VARGERVSEGESGEGSREHAGTLCVFLPPAQRACDDHGMRTKDRRRRRGQTITEALTYQLTACCEDGRIEAMVLADEDGLPLATSGDTYACDEVAARIVLVGSRIQEFNGTLLGGGSRWDVQMLKVPFQGTDLVVCAVGGTADSRKRQIRRGAEGALRILAA
jgi:hypothetical protein